MAALGGAGEGLDAELVCLGLQEKPSETNQVTGTEKWAIDSHWLVNSLRSRLLPVLPLPSQNSKPH